MSRLLQRWPDLLLAGLVAVSDQVSKHLVASRIPFHGEVPVIPGLLSLRPGRNPGIAFGVFSAGDLPHQAAFLTAFTVVALVALLAWSVRLPPRPRLPRLALALVMGGALGNLVDRVRLGSVLDFIHVYWGRFQWHDFNVADGAISVGVVLLLLASWRPDRPAA